MASLADLARTVQQGQQPETPFSFEDWLERAYDKAQGPEDVDLEALETQLRALDCPEWSWASALEDGPEEQVPDDSQDHHLYSLAWLQEYDQSPVYAIDRSS